MQQVTEVVSKTLRGMDVVLRYGVQGVAVVLPGIRLAEAEHVARRLRRAVADKGFLVEGRDLRVTVGIGIAEAVPEEDPKKLVERAEAALGAAQDAGRNRVYLHSGQARDPIRPVLRQSRRYAVGKTPRIAPYTNGQLPEEARFQEVFCADLSPGGFAYLLDKRPEYRRLIVELGTCDDPKYMVATVKSCVRAEGEQFRVGCMFTGRLETPGVANAG
jgi:hypothetical protein